MELDRMRALLKLMLWIYMISESFCESSTKKPRQGATTQASTTKRLQCPTFDTEYVLSNSTVHERCCKRIHGGFLRKWYLQNRRLASNLNLLKTWKCRQLERECVDETFAFSEYAKALYARVCDSEAYNKKCDRGNSTLEHIRIMINFSNEGSGFTDPTTEVPKKHLPLEQLLKPCVQASLFEDGKTSGYQYQEIIKSRLPFCEIVWCALPSYAFDEYDITVSTCMSKRCRTNLFVFMTFFGLLAFAIIVANVTVLAVFTLTSWTINSQIIYKISLAVADLLAGLVVFPGMMESMKRSFLIPLKEVNGTILGEKVLEGAFSSQFLNAVGFFTTVSFVASIYTLLAASMDRFFVVFRPLKYDIYKAAKTAKIAVGIVWSVGFVVSLVPVFHEEIRYDFVSSVLVSITGPGSIAVYCIAIALPLVLACCTNGATYAFYVRNARTARSVNPAARVQAYKNEKRLLKTLSIMVGIFTLCLFPMLIVLVLIMTLHGIDQSKPKKLILNRERMLLSFEAVAVLILMSNSLWNFFIYNGRSAEFRKAAISLYKGLPGRIWRALSKRTHSVRKRISLARLTSTSTERTSETTMHI